MRQAYSSSLDGTKKPRLVSSRAIAANPSHAEAYRSLAQSLLMLGQKGEAKAAASRAIAIEPAFVTAYLTRAEISNDLGHESEAIADYSRMLELEPDNKDAMLAKARLLCRRSQYDEAVALCDAVIAIDPCNPIVYYEVGRAFEGKRELAAAAISYAKASELDPEWLSPVLQRGRALLELSKLDEALAALDKAVESQRELR